MAEAPTEIDAVYGDTGEQESTKTYTKEELKKELQNLVAREEVSGRQCGFR